MRHLVCLSILFFSGLVLQVALIPAFLPPVLRPDAGILIALAMLSFGTCEFGVAAVFLMGVGADLMGSGRFGLLTFCYLLTAGVMILTAWRELQRGGFGAPLVACVAGTAAAHGMYCALAAVIGVGVPATRVFGEVLSLLVGACVWGLPSVYLVGKLMYHLRVMSPEVQARWANDERMAEARRQSVV